MLNLYNDLNRRKELFTPSFPGKVSLYVCGMTVYDYCHLGHARVMVAFDVVYRYLQALGYEVTYIRNITDIDDKIIQRANNNGEPFTELSQRFIDAMHEDADALGVLRPTAEPKATDHLGAIINMIQRLVDRGHAYAAENGDVYYSVRSFPGYGKLSGKSLDDLEAGARVEPDEVKRDPLDFALWKAAKPGEPSWTSPWGEGRPGWHIECSAMSTQALGPTLDIHGGGADLTFPHHENEIAQSEGATGQPFVRYWMHNGFVRINDEKMSKSLGNFFTIRDILKEYRPEEVRYFMLTSQYRSPLNFDRQQLDNARAALTRFYTALRDLPDVEPAEGGVFSGRFHEAMQDDFNTPEALAALFDLTREINRTRSKNTERAAQLGALLRQLAGMLGLLQGDSLDYLQGMDSDESDGLTDANIDRLIKERLEAKVQKNWVEADRIRDMLKGQGIFLEDAGDTTRWRRGGG